MGGDLFPPPPHISTPNCSPAAQNLLLVTTIFPSSFTSPPHSPSPPHHLLHHHYPFQSPLPFVLSSVAKAAPALSLTVFLLHGSAHPLSQLYWSPPVISSVFFPGWFRMR